MTGVRDSVEYHAIPRVTFDELLDGSPRFTLEPGIGIAMVLFLYTQKLLGAGLFKVAHSGILDTLDREHEPVPVAVKRPYRGHASDPTKKLFLSAPDTLKKLEVEANTLYWAYALLELALDYYTAKTSSLPSPPLAPDPLPSFVNAGLALVWEEGTIKGGSVPKKTFLLEQLLPSTEGDFRKLINNGSAQVLNTDTGDVAIDNLASFLSCIQHIQYEKTGKLAYISDFQGSSSCSYSRAVSRELISFILVSLNLLTDPQILTSPYVPLRVLDCLSTDYYSGI